MAVLRKKDIREMGKEQMDKKMSELVLELSKERGKIDVGGVPDNPGKIREIKKTIARMLTIKKEMQKKNARSMS